MKRIKTADNSIIESIRYMTLYNTDSKKPFIESILKEYQLTSDFINSFKDYITKENFSKSYMLTKELSEKYSEYFDKEIFIKNVCETNSISFDMLLENFDDLKNEYEKNNNLADFERLLKKTISNAEKNEVNSGEIITLLGFSNAVDELLLKRIDDDSIKNILLLAVSLDGKDSLSAISAKYLDNETKEDLIGTEDVDIKTFLKYISESNDFGWILKMLKNANEGKIKLIKNSTVTDKEIINLLSNSTEGIILEFVKLKNFMPNAISYKSLLWLLQNKDLSEDTLIELFDIFKSSGLFFELKKYANKREYGKLLSILK